MSGASRLRAANDRTDRCVRHRDFCSRVFAEAVLADVRFGRLKLEPATSKAAEQYREAEAAIDAAIADSRAISEELTRARTAPSTETVR